MIGHWRRVRATIFLFTAAFPLLPSPTTAQASGQGFLFKQPTVQVGVHGGYTLARAGGSVLDFARSELTLNKRDFDASSWGLELAVRAKERLDIAFDVRFSTSEVGSEMREWVDQDNLPIQQTTTFVRVPVTVGAKFYLGDRGRAISQFVWIPAKLAPFVGAGGGFLWYRFGQNGDFVDIVTLDVVNFTLESSGGTATGHVFAGVDISIGPRFLWTLEGRYGLGGATTGSAFNFDHLDLSGLQATIGLAVRF